MITAEKILGKGVTDRLKPMWSVDAEGEIRTAWRDSGVPNFWFMMGNLMLCRFHSKHLALRESVRWSCCRAMLTVERLQRSRPSKKVF